MRAVFLVLCTASAIGSAATAQEVRGFIDPSRAAGALPICQWRAALKSPGGYVDAASDGRVPFYARIPFPKTALKIENAQLAGRTDLAAVPYLELKGALERDGSLSWSFKHFVIPALVVQGGATPQFDVASITFGAYPARLVFVQPLPPRAPLRVSFEDYMPDVLASLRTDSRLRLELTRYAWTGNRTAPRVILEAALPELEADIKAIAAKARAMQAANGAQQCGVPDRECFDGSCG